MVSQCETRAPASFVTMRALLLMQVQPAGRAWPAIFMNVTMLDKIDFDNLIPDVYAEYRPLVRDALAFFLAELPPERAAAIAASQLRLPIGAPAAARLVSLLRHCPTLHKLGQVLARDERLDADLRSRLQRLETLPGTTEVSTVMPAIDRATAGVTGIRIAPAALAEASVAVVVPFEWSRDAGTNTTRGVFKVLKPGIRERMEQELTVWARLGEFLEERCARYGLPPLDYREIVDGVSRRLRHEVDLSYEQVHLQQAASLYQDASRVNIPELLPFCRDDVTGMGRIDGIKLTDAPQADRRQAERDAVTALIATPFLSNDPNAPFHADPHPGNLYLSDEGPLAIFDWSLVVRLGPKQRGYLTELIISGLMLDPVRACRALEALSRRSVDGPALREVAANAMRRVRWGASPGFHWLTRLLDRAVFEARVSLDEDLVLFRKAIHTLNGVLEQLSHTGGVDGVLLNQALSKYVHQATGVAPGKNQSANRALMELWWSMPATASRFWMGAWRDAMTPVRA